MRRIIIAALGLALTTAACGATSAAAPTWTFAPTVAAAPATDEPTATPTSTVQPETLSAATPNESTTVAGSGAPGATDGTAAALAPSTAAVRIANFDFTPATVTIQAGGKVTWTNADGDRHSILLDGSESPRLDQNGTFTKAFSTAGRFAYVCGLHSSMSGEIVVVDAGSAGTRRHPGTTATPGGDTSPDATAAPTASPDDHGGDDDADDDGDDDHSGHGGGGDDSG